MIESDKVNKSMSDRTENRGTRYCPWHYGIVPRDPSMTQSTQRSLAENDEIQSMLPKLRPVQCCEDNQKRSERSLPAREPAEDEFPEENPLGALSRS